MSTIEVTFDFACRDDCLDRMVPSDLRALVIERDRLRAELAAAKEAIAAEREACAQVAYNFPTMHGFHSCYGVADAIRNRAAEMNQIRSRQEPQE